MGWIGLGFSLSVEFGIIENIESMENKNKLLPTLTGSKSKTRLSKDRLKIEDLLLKNANNRSTHKDYRSNEDFAAIKASNFLSRIETLDSPEVIFAVADQIKEATRISKDKENVNDPIEPHTRATLSSFRNPTLLQSAKVTFHRAAGEGRMMAEEREQALELARWLDDKLKGLRNKSTITFLDILDYKHTILNYALGRIIDSLSRRCKEEGQILSLIWENTFKMFEGVFSVLVQANRNQEKENSTQAKEMQTLFETNHNFLIQENASLKKENTEIFEQMRKVIDWNKRLRRDRKALNTSNRVLQYRNTTYGQALEETLEMLLQSTPDPTILQTAKKMVLKLGRQKNRRKHNFKQEVQEEVGKNTREVVFNWLKKNSCLDEEKLELFKDSCFSKQDGFLFSELDDLNEMKKVDIYDFFKLYDVAVQVVPETSSSGSQCDNKIVKHVEIMTRNISTTEHGCQTLPVRKNSIPQASNEILPINKKHVEIAINKQPSTSKYKKQKSKTPLKPKELKELTIISSNKEKQQEKEKQNEKQRQLNTISNIQDRLYKTEIRRDLRKTSVNDFYFRERQESSILKEDREKVSEGRINVSLPSGVKIDEERGEWQHPDSSISELLQDDIRTKGQVTTKNIFTYNSQADRQKSLTDFNDNINTNTNTNQNPIQNKNQNQNQNQNQNSNSNPHPNAILNASSGSVRMIQMGMGRRYGEKKKSVAYIRADTSKPLNKLHSSRKFNDIFPANKQTLQNNKEEFVDQIIRRRSFFSRRRVEFADSREAEEVTERFRQYMRGTKYGVGYRKVVVEKASALNSSVDRWTKRGPAPSNIAKSKALTSAKGVFEAIVGSIQEVVRIPPKNKAFVSNSIGWLAKYVGDLVSEYVRQLKKEKEEIPNECERALYPLSHLLMDRMTYKYGLKGIAERKIKHFIQKVLTFASVSQKVTLYSLLLGLDDKDVGSDQLLVYLKCLAYFEEKKPGRDATESTLANLQLVRDHLRRLLEYFFDGQYVNLMELKLQIYLQQSAPFSTVEGIALIVIRQLLRRKKELRLRYSRVHQVCSRGDNFFSNIFHLLRLVTHYRQLVLTTPPTLLSSQNKEPIQALKRMKSRGNKRQDKTQRKILPISYDICQIALALRELLKRSDIMDEEYGKSITEERFVTAAMLLNLPNAQDLDAILDFMCRQFSQLREDNPEISLLSCEDFRHLDRLARVWNKSSVLGEGEPIWAFAKIYAQKIEQEVLGVMGEMGTIGYAIEGFLFNLEPPTP